MRKRSRVQLNNQGSGIVTVLVVCTFITIIATTLLYVTGKNYTSKQTNYQTKENFYQAEEALDLLKGYLVSDVSDAFEYAYKETMANYVTHTGTTNLNDFYAQSYTDRLKEIWTDRQSATTCGNSEVDQAFAGQTDALTRAVQKFLAANLVADGKTVADATVIASRITAVSTIYIPPERDQFIFYGVKARYESDSGYSTYLSTDIGLELPDLYLADMTGTYPAAYAGQTVELAECVKYMNWKQDD